MTHDAGSPADRGVRCSFCLKPEQDVAKIIAGTGSYICDECVAACVAILAAPAGAASANSEPDPDSARLPSWRSMSDEQLLDRLPRIAAVAAQVEAALAQWVRECRRRGASWAKVGDVLRMSRQSAWERFSDVG